MKEIVQDRINKMEDLQQRRMLKNMMTSVFLNLVEYQDDLNRKLERRVFDEIEGNEGNHDVFTALCPREELDPIHEFLYPMIPQDTEATVIDMKCIVDALSQKEEVLLTTVFLECNYSIIKQLLNSDRKFKGELVTSKGRYNVQVRLKQNRVYQDEIEKLYHVFITNGLPWRTVNHPYIHKFVDVMLTACDGELAETEEISEVTVHLEEYESFKRMNLIPLWNIQKLELKTGGFPIPAEDRVNYEHVLPLRKTGIRHGYLVDGDEEDIRYIKRTQDEITIVSPRDKSDIWHLLQLAEPVETVIGKLYYDVISNRRVDGFIGKYRHKQDQRVRSKGEIIRMIQSFEQSKILELVDHEIDESGVDHSVTYELNPFVNDHVRSEQGKARLLLRFRSREVRGNSQFISEDLMSFLVSEIQLAFPEYKCEGEWA
ncbi:normocyte-binding protein [Paenibacillus glacialis]|uniref:Normocyte-binding protein n=1 Tax=Paenibacillus glacialis TaxID=494026 RepID=A0A168N7S1_9BACL|nr:normocyte-binding protein [Paenibacillus glacialis]OAB45493.1 normocyte-binding protein [Paenibacillus glacialis]